MPQVSSIQRFGSPVVSAVSEVSASSVDGEGRETGFSLIPAAEHDARSAVPPHEGYDLFQNYDIAVFQNEKQYSTSAYIL
jgi:hypothetical protein